MEIVHVQTPPCVMCKQFSLVRVVRSDFDRWQVGELIQVAFPEMLVDDRELLINGTHPECWEKMGEGD